MPGSSISERAVPNSPVSQSMETIASAKSHENLKSIFWQTEPLDFGAFMLDYPGQYHYTVQLYFQYQEVKQLLKTDTWIFSGREQYRFFWWLNRRCVDIRS